VRPEGLSKFKNHPIGYRTRDLPVCSIVHFTNMLPRAPVRELYKIKQNYKIKNLYVIACCVSVFIESIANLSYSLPMRILLHSLIADIGDNGHLSLCIVLLSRVLTVFLISSRFYYFSSGRHRLYHQSDQCRTKPGL
jgi:hypothetical protein